MFNTDDPKVEQTVEPKYSSFGELPAQMNICISPFT